MPRCNTVDDFWRQVQRGSGCWLWIGAHYRRGYGAFRYHGRQWKAHRFAWQLHNGAIPHGLQINHHCDNPACVNPAHLYAGDQKANRLDAVRRGRTAKGERHGAYTHPESRRLGEMNGNHKLTDDERAAVRVEHRRGVSSLAEVGKRYGVTKQTVWHIVGRGR